VRKNEKKRSQGSGVRGQGSGGRKPENQDNRKKRSQESGARIQKKIIATKGEDSFEFLVFSPQDKF